MALIHCPECGNTISDKAITCPRCGVTLVKCPECSNIIIQGAQVCPHCGVEFDNNAMLLHQQDINPMQKDYSEEGNMQPDIDSSSSSPRTFGSLLKFIIPIAILFVFAITVPNKSDHIKAIKSAIVESMEEPKDEYAQFGAAIGVNIIDKVLESQLKVNNYFIFSVGRIETEKEDKTISFGILTHVFVGDIDKSKLNDSTKK